MPTGRIIVKVYSHVTEVDLELALNQLNYKIETFDDNTGIARVIVPSGNEKFLADRIAKLPGVESAVPASE